MSGGHLELPFPAKVLWPNGRTRSFMKRHRVFQEHKHWAFVATKAAKNRGELTHIAIYTVVQPTIQWSATFYPKTSHAIDDDNARASLKAYQDGIAAALGLNDRFFAAPTIHFAEPVKNGRVVIVIGCGDSSQNPQLVASAFGAESDLGA